jgi:hypothetical protein
MFEPDILNDAASLRNARRALTPERRLLIAILTDAVECYQKNLQAHTAKQRRICREAEKWMLSDDQHWVFSFRNICDALGVDADALRERARAWKEPPSGHPLEVHTGSSVVRLPVDRPSGLFAAHRLRFE